LSIKNLGAARCVGFDQSSAFLAQAAELKAVGALECQFVEGDIYQTAPEFDSAFDLVVITIGVLGWMPELGKFFDVAVRLLRPGGQLFIHEQHPITNMLEPGDGDPFALVHSYFRSEPFADDDIIVYDDEDAGKGKTYYWFVHTLADTITACLERGLALDHFAEYPTNISSEEFDRFEDREAQLPLSYSLTASKGSPPRGQLKT
jgi:SAM-dependent methyltransferase